ncbi:hypothetical protein PR048_012732 [Dryococelus australis]|uniref:Uncharacterized protein n=1 Tax=Dryococelus australis TaxID=614101 RepID=A0ABQ9HR19_9NEOP|nr:hypothetical protein PR048_012732 [Dryococelus australis]
MFMHMYLPGFELISIARSATMTGVQKIYLNYVQTSMLHIEFNMGISGPLQRLSKNLTNIIDPGSATNNVCGERRGDLLSALRPSRIVK